MSRVLKNDKYRKSRGGQARLLDIHCVGCNSKVLIYQKDGKGFLHRIYLNRIFWPEEFELLQRKIFQSIKEIPNLQCDDCGEVIGTPMRHIDGRYAFRLRYGYFFKEIHQDGKIKV